MGPRLFKRETLQPKCLLLLTPNGMPITSVILSFIKPSDHRFLVILSRFYFRLAAPLFSISSRMPYSWIKLSTCVNRIQFIRYIVRKIYLHSDVCLMLTLLLRFFTYIFILLGRIL